MRLDFLNIFSEHHDGLVYDFKNNGKVSISLLTACSKNNLLSTEGQIENIENEEALSRLVKTNARVNLTIIGSGVLIKKISNKAKNQLETIKTAFPFLKGNDFLIQTYNTKQEIFVSAVKREMIEDILIKLNTKDIFPVSLTIGPFSFAQIIPMIDRLQGKIVLRGYELKYFGDEIWEVEKSTEESNDCVIGEEVLHCGMALNFSSILQMLSPKNISLQDEGLDKKLKDDFSQKKFFHTFKLYGGIFLFLSLLINFLFFVKLSSKNEKLKGQSSTAVIAKQKLDFLFNVYKEKKIFVDSLNIKSESRIAYYSDKLAIDLPLVIKWETLTIHPSKKKALGNDGFDFDQSKIFVKGICPNPIVLEEWIKVIKANDWVSQVENQKYFYNEEKRLGRFEFYICIAENEL